MRRFFSAAAALLSAATVLLFCTSCGSEKPYTKSFDVSDSDEQIFSVTLYGGDRKSRGEESKDAAMAAAAEKGFKAFESAASYLDENNPASPLYMLNSDIDSVLDCDLEVITLLEKVFELSADTGGAFQPCGGAYTELLASGDCAQEDIDKALTHTGIDKFTVAESSVTKNDKSAKLDLYAASDGYALQKAAQSLEDDETLEYGLISVNSTIAVVGTPPDGRKLNIAVPGDGGDIGYFTVQGGFVSGVDTSSETYDFGVGAGGLKSVAVWAEDGITANALAHAVFCMGKDAALELHRSGKYKFAAVMTDGDGNVTLTDDAEKDGIFLIQPKSGENKSK